MTGVGQKNAIQLFISIFGSLIKAVQLSQAYYFVMIFFRHGHFGYYEISPPPIYMVYFYHMYVQFQGNFEDYVLPSFDDRFLGCPRDGRLYQNG